MQTYKFNLLLSTLLRLCSMSLRTTSTPSYLEITICSLSRARGHLESAALGRQQPSGSVLCSHRNPSLVQLVRSKPDHCQHITDPSIVDGHEVSGRIRPGSVFVPLKHISHKLDQTNVDDHKLIQNKPVFRVVLVVTCSS
jgi:hypothetical protein